MKRSLVKRARKLPANSRRIRWADVRAVAFDIDDTFSTQGKITAAAFAALWRLHQAGVILVPITGRPAGWCDHIARFWPVDAVIGENGAFALRHDPRTKKLLRSDALPTALSQSARGRLAGLRTALLSEFPGLMFASDQNYREFDLAIDICEDVPAWSAAEVDRLLAFCEKQGAHAKLSSIHVNTWFGDYTKHQGFEAALAQGGVLAGTRAARLKPEHWVFVGDSPNDEPLFAAFAQSVGVANLKRYLPRLKTPPMEILKSASGAGFVELAQKILRSRR